MIQKTYICPLTRKRIRVDDATADGVPNLEYADDDALPAGWGSLRLVQYTTLRHLLADDIAKMAEGEERMKGADVTAEERAQFEHVKAQFDEVLAALGDRAVGVVYDFGELSDEGIARVTAALAKEGVELKAPNQESVRALLQSTLGGAAEAE